MAEIRLTEGTIRHQNEWLSADDIKARIKEKMDAGDMKFAGLAAALEELNRAMENAQEIQVRIVLPKADYEKLKKRGGDDDSESVRQAILAFIEGNQKKSTSVEMEMPAQSDPNERDKAPAAGGADAEPPAAGETVPCTKCQKPVPVPSADRPLELECEFCGTSIILEAEEKEGEAAGKPEPDSGKSIRHQDHFIG